MVRGYYSGTCGISIERLAYFYSCIARYSTKGYEKMEGKFFEVKYINHHSWFDVALVYHKSPELAQKAFLKYYKRSRGREPEVVRVTEVTMKIGKVIL